MDKRAWLLSFQFLPCIDNFLSVPIVLGFRKYFSNKAFLINQKGGTMQAKIITAKQLLFTPNPILINNCMGGVRNQRKGKAEFFFKFFVTFFVIRADAKHYKTLFFQ